MDFSWKLSLDGLMTLIAGFIAFAAVIIQIRSSSRQLQKQLEAQREAQLAEEKRQNRAVANAILFEIDDFYRFHLRDPRNFLDAIDPQKDKLPGIGSVGPSPFPVYCGNAAKIGELDVGNVEAIVHFYAAASSYLSILQEYKASMERAERGKFLSMIGRGTQDLSALADEADARMHLGRMKGALPELIRFTWLVCHQLCEFTDITFEFPRIGVAAEQLSIKDFKIPSKAKEGGPKL